MAKQSIWSTSRRSGSRPEGGSDKRTEFEKDYDRLLFSTPVRRLADKTQVFPLERNDSVRNRLTHSHEVANLARSMGIRLIRTNPAVFGDSDEARNAAPVILSAVGLAHDLGNPPFGHQGEDAIQAWFSANKDILSGLSGDEPRQDFELFEGNAQALRLVTRLQNTSGPAGLNLTAATLAALMKYPMASTECDKGRSISKKHGFFRSEKEVVSWIRDETGLPEGRRHPLTWLMEAADDIAYSVLDVEDATKKGLVSPEDLLAKLREQFAASDLGGLCNQLTKDFVMADHAKHSLSRVREIKTTYLRTRLIERLVTGAVETYLADHNRILRFERELPLLECSTNESTLCEALKNFVSAHAFRSTSVLELELVGARALSSIMDGMWQAIVKRKKIEDLGSRRTNPFAAYVYSLISDSYRWHFEKEASPELSIRYRELQLLTDMVSGMTDGFAQDTAEKIERYSPNRDS